MGFIGLLLKSLFLTGLFIAVFLIVMVAYFMIKIRNMKRAFGQNMHSKWQNYNTRNTSQHSNNTGQSTQAEEVYDSRPSQEASRKIFAKDEGEYVEFEEEQQ